MRYVRLALLAILTPFLAYVGLLVAAVILCIPAIAFTNNYEYFSPALNGEPRHLIGFLGCLAGVILGGISPWFTILNLRKKPTRRQEYGSSSGSDWRRHARGNPGFPEGLWRRQSVRSFLGLLIDIPAW